MSEDKGKSPKVGRCHATPINTFMEMDAISMDFIVGLPNTSRHHDSIWVIVDRLTKVAHFLPVHTTDKAQNYAELYIDRIVCLHGLPRTIVSDWEPNHTQILGTVTRVLGNQANKMFGLPPSN
jgi:hypothetical protein